MAAVPCVSLLALLPFEQPIRVDVAPHGKGLGAFAEADIPAGAHVCSYRGELLSRKEVLERYGTRGGEYLFELAEDIFIDGAETSHSSRFINHGYPAGNLLPAPCTGVSLAAAPADDRGSHGPPSASVSAPHAQQALRVDFFAARAIHKGEELTFDYGVPYWVARGSGPAPGTDSRSAWIGLRRAMQAVGPVLRALRASVPL
jgi:SET domain-containing protein